MAQLNIDNNAAAAQPAEQPTVQPSDTGTFQYTPEEKKAETTAASDTIVNTTNLCTINDKNTPILVLFGPSQCGKSMTMVRLLRYVRDNGYVVKPRNDFRPSSDETYKIRCEAFNDTLNTFKPLPGTNEQDYMLATVHDSRGTCCLQVLEAPGEHYFSSRSRNPETEPFPAYLDKIKNSTVPKIWCFFVEPDWLGAENNKNYAYVDRIRRSKKYINLKKDRIIILMNKIDKCDEMISFGKVNIKAAMRLTDQQYPGLFKAFENDRMIEKLWKPYLCDFVPFSTGDFDKQNDTFTESQDVYPATLWAKIMKR